MRGYRRSVMLASGRYAMLDGGKGFSLVHRAAAGTAACRDGTGRWVSWEIGRQRGNSIG
ncbi:DUF3363 domain-containing protein [Cupriavidus sp. PET2-C1]